VSFEWTSENIEKVNALPGSWMPRRNQPEWDRDFNGRTEIQQNFNARTDKAGDWAMYALAFSEVILGGFAGGGDDGLTLADMGANARAFIAKGANQGLDA
jgi:hypothetical protein